MVRNTQPRVSSLRLPEIPYVLNQMFPFSRLQDHRVQQPRRIPFNPIPTVVIREQKRLRAHAPHMTCHDVVHETLQDAAAPADCSERQ